MLFRQSCASRSRVWAVDCVACALLRPLTLHRSDHATGRGAHAAVLERVGERVAADVQVLDELNHVAHVRVMHDVEPRQAEYHEER